MDCLSGKTIISILCLLPVFSLTAQESIYENMGPRETSHLSGGTQELETPSSSNESLNLPSSKKDDNFYQNIPPAKEKKDFYQGPLTKDQHAQAEGQQIAGQDLSKLPFLVSKKKERFQKYHNHGRTMYSFNFIKDRYNVMSHNNVFHSTYEGSGNHRYGTLTVTRYKYFFKNPINLGWGIGFGFGFNAGHPHFISRTKSDVEFKLFTLPFDLSLTGEIPIGSFLRMGLSLGPSAMGLFQSRDDFERGEEGKYRRQIGGGYSASAYIRPSLSWLLPSTGKDIFNQYKANNLFFNILARYHYYDSFQDKILIKGLSYGVGFSFEFL